MLARTLSCRWRFLVDCLESYLVLKYFSGAICTLFLYAFLPESSGRSVEDVLGHWMTPLNTEEEHLVKQFPRTFESLANCIVLRLFSTCIDRLGRWRRCYLVR